MAHDVLNAVKREGTGKEKAKKLRFQGLIPAIYYHHGETPQSLTLNLVEFNRIYHSGNKIIDLKIGKTSKKVLIRDMQFHPVSEAILHVDFQGVQLSEEISLSVSIKLIGSSVGMKEGGILESLVHDLEIKCKVSDIPHELVVDVSELEMGQGVYARDLTYDNIEILTPSDAMIVMVSAPSGSNLSDEDEEGEEETEETEETAEEESEK